MNFSNEPLNKSFNQNEITQSDFEYILNGDCFGIFIHHNDKHLAEIYYNCVLESFELHVINSLNKLPMLAGNYSDLNHLVADIKSLV